MPVYEYECKECGDRFEKMQPITADPLKDCPRCGKSALRRVFHPVGVIFKGSGWYITDNRNSNSNNRSNKDTDSSKADDKSSADKSGAKSESSTSSSESSAEAKPATNPTDQA